MRHRLMSLRMLPGVMGLTLFLWFNFSPLEVKAAQYTAYSLRIAQKRIEEAGENWRQKEPDVTNLADINKVEGFVYDSNIGDLILVGEHEQGRATLTLDDLVVALRARFRYNEWPLVSIDPTPDTEKTQMQHVRFEGGIQGTAFGQAMFEADYRLKELSMNLAEPGISSFQTAWDRNLAEVEGVTVPGQRQITSRFWFYPINPHVVVREGVCVVRGLKVGVFTEVLSAKIDGKPVEDIKAFKNAANDAFASDVSQRFDELCQTQPSFNRLRGLQELVAVSKALEELEKRPDLSYWLEQYVLTGKQTQREVKVLRRKYEGKRHWFEVSGGVHLTAMAMRLNAGDVTALREAVLKVRPSSDKLWWSFVAAEWLIPIRTGQTKPEDIAPLFTQAVFLQDQERHTDALVIYDEILKLWPLDEATWGNKGVALSKLERWDEAIRCLSQTLQINQRSIRGYINRGVAYTGLRDYLNAFEDFDKAIHLDPKAYDAYYNRALTFQEKGDIEQATEDYTKALELNPSFVNAYVNRGAAYRECCEYDLAFQDLNAAIRLAPSEATVYLNRGITYYKTSSYQKALEDCTLAIQLNRRDPQAYISRGNVYSQGFDNHEAAIQDYTHAIKLRPDLPKAYNNRGNEYLAQKNYARALADYDSAIKLDRNCAEAHNGLGTIYKETGKLEQSIIEFDRAIKLKPDLSGFFFNRGLSYFLLKDYGRASEDFTKVIALDPNYIEAYSNRGTIHAIYGDYAQAVADYDKAILLAPQEIDLYYNRGLAYKNMQDNDLAIADFSHVLTLKPDHADAFFQRGYVHMKKGENRQAISDLDKCLAVNPRDAGAWYNKAKIHDGTKQYADALQAYKKFVNLASPEYAQYVEQARQSVRKLEKQTTNVNSKRSPTVPAEERSAPETGPSQISKDDLVLGKQQSAQAQSSKIVFASNRDGNLEIYTMNPDGSNMVRLTDHPAKDAEPKWSPDGQKIAFKSDRDGNDELYIMTADGKNPTNLSRNDATDEDCSWSPDSQELCFASNRDGNFEIYRIHVNGKNLTRLTKHPFKDLSPCWSPCGKLIIFVSWREEPDGIYIMNVDGTGVRRLPVTGGNPRWSPNGKKIIFHHSTNSNLDIWIINPDGKGLKRLTDNPAPEGLSSYSPNGSQIAFIRIVAGKSAIFVMKDDGTSAQQVSPIGEIATSPCWSPFLSAAATSLPLIVMKNDIFHLEFMRPGFFWESAIEVKGQRHQTTFVTLSVKILNLSSQEQTIDVSSGFKLLHPREYDAFRLLKGKPGPYILEFARGETKECEIQYIMNPTLSSLDIEGLDSLEWETFLGRAKIPLEKQLKMK